MKWKLRAFWALLSSFVYSVAFFNNSKKYSQESFGFRSLKSFFDAGLSLLLATKFPALLIGYITFWFSSFFSKSPMERITASVLAGVFLNSVSSRYKEIEVVLGVFGTDLVTSRFVYHWRRLDSKASFQKI